MKSKVLSAVVLVCMLLILVSCSSFSFTVGSGRRYGHKSGPPPHAPAHGHRHRHRGVELVYDSDCGVYVVIGLSSHYYSRDRYYRFGENQWEVGVSLKGPWKSISRNDLPKGLRNMKKVTGEARGRLK
jgi:hypothetical protein